MLGRLAMLALLIACSRASQEGEAKQWATPPPGKDIAIPVDLHIAVTSDGGALPEITSERLQHARPDFADDDHKAWLIPTLVPEAGPAGTSIEAMSGTGVSVTFAHPTADGREPVLFLTRRGDVIVGALDPRDPFPRYHGQGGRLRRAGDPMPRVSPVARLAITHTRP
ncbi:MAG TPA: hypothetical protein VF469_30545 [Kofleriaceae bacterium]